MRWNGVCYDVGRVMLGQNWRPDFELSRVRRELEIIRDDLRCNAVRICGEDIGRLGAAAELALEAGLDVWFCPELWDRDADETLGYITDAAGRAEELRRRHPGGDRLVFSVGSELTLFMRGIVEGRWVMERLGHPSFWERVRSGEHNGPLNAFLAKANASARARFGGPVTYASVPLETVEWARFDYVAIDLYRDARTRGIFADLLGRWFAFGRPVVVTEFGCCTYRGAADAGGMGWAVVDANRRPPLWKRACVRDESEQARELTEALGAMGAAGVAGAFVMTFVAPLFPHHQDPALDLDMASYSLVKSHADRRGEVYPELPWDPKASFAAVAAHYGAHPPSPA